MYGLEDIYMTKPQEPFPKVPPFYIPPAKPPRKKIIDIRGMLSIITTLVSLAALTLSMLGATRFILDIFDDGLAGSLDGLLVKLIVLGFAFFFGWVFGLVSIRVFGNLVYPIVIQMYAWGCLVAVSLLYIKVIQKLFLQNYDALHFWAYLFMLLGGLFVLICLHLMVEDHELRPFAIPLLVISVLQLFVIIARYVFVANPNGWMLFGDFAILGVMVSISALMLAHIGILSPLRNLIDDLFTASTNSNQSGE